MAPTWNEKLELSDASYSVPDIHYILVICISKKTETITDNPSIIIYVNQLENRITFRVNTRFYNTFFLVWSLLKW